MLSLPRLGYHKIGSLVRPDICSWFSTECASIISMLVTHLQYMLYKGECYMRTRDGVDADINDHSPRLQPGTLDHLWLPDGDYHNVRLLNLGR